MSSDLFVPIWSMPYGQRYPATRTSSTSCCPLCQKKIIVIQLLSLVWLTNLVGCPCSNVVNTLVWRFFTRRWIIFRLFLWITSQFHHCIGLLEPPTKINLCHCQFVGAYWCLQIFIFPRTITDWNSLPLAVRLLQSILVLVLEVDGLCSHVSCSHPYLTSTCPAGFWRRWQMVLQWQTVAVCSIDDPDAEEILS